VKFCERAVQRRAREIFRRFRITVGLYRVSEQEWHIFELPHGRNHLAAQRLQRSSSVYSHKGREYSGEICLFIFLDQLRQYGVLKNVSFS